MSYIRWIPSEPPGRTRWRYFPLAVIIAMGVVVAANVGMVYAALDSFPGAAGDDESFELSNHYDTVLDQAQREAALGWTVSAQADDTRRPVVVLIGRDGAPLGGVSLSGSAERPVGVPHTYRLQFLQVGQGRYVADAALPLPGQWDLTLSASVEGHSMAVTRRIIVR